MTQGRGQLTPRIQEKAKELLGRAISQVELRLMPYVSYVLMNDQKLNPNCMNQADREAWQTWKQAGWVEGGITGVSITREFWIAIHEIILLGYVDLS